MTRRPSDESFDGADDDADRGLAPAPADVRPPMPASAEADNGGTSRINRIRAQDEDGDRLSDVEMVTMVLALVTAGHETTAHLIGNGALALLAHPDQLAALRRDPGCAPKAPHAPAASRPTRRATP